jgi:hypothetical protein
VGVLRVAGVWRPWLWEGADGGLWVVAVTAGRWLPVEELGSNGEGALGHCDYQGRRDGYRAGARPG